MDNRLLKEQMLKILRAELASKDTDNLEELKKRHNKLVELLLELYINQIPDRG